MIINNIEDGIRKLNELKKWVDDAGFLSEGQRNNVKRRLTGDFGEVIGASVIEKNLGVKIDLKGGHTKGYDISICEGKIKFQIKTSSKEKYVFKVLNNIKGSEDVRKVFDKRGKASYLIKIEEVIRKAVDNSIADYWFLIHIKDDALEYYLLNKKEFKELVVEEHKDYVNHEDHHSPGYGIQGKLRIQFEQKKDCVREYLSKCKATDQRWKQVKDSYNRKLSR